VDDGKWMVWKKANLTYIEIQSLNAPCVTDTGHEKSVRMVRQGILENGSVITNGGRSVVSVPEV
jgi:hypothetical protein